MILAPSSPGSNLAGVKSGEVNRVAVKAEDWGLGPSEMRWSAGIHHFLEHVHSLRR